MVSLMRTRWLISVSLLAFLAFAPACGGGDDDGGDGGGDFDSAPRVDGDEDTDGAAGGPDANNDVCNPGTTPAQCNFFTGCGCTETQKCSVNSTERACSAAGAMTAGQACTADDQCVAGTACITYPSGGEARQCMTFCDDAHACPTTPVAGACYITITGGGGAELGKVCGDTCSLLGQDCASPTGACHPASVAAAAERGICITAGTGTQGSACGAGTPGCAEGYACVTPEGSTPICSELCDRTAAPPAQCDAGTECRSLSGHTMTGICLPL